MANVKCELSSILLQSAAWCQVRPRIYWNESSTIRRLIFEVLGFLDQFFPQHPPRFLFICSPSTLKTWTDCKFSQSDVRLRTESVRFSTVSLKLKSMWVTSNSNLKLELDNMFTRVVCFGGGGRGRGGLDLALWRGIISFFTQVLCTPEYFMKSFFSFQMKNVDRQKEPYD